MTRLSGFVLGLLTFVGAHRIEVAMWSLWFGGSHTPWFLNSGHAIVFTMACLFGVSLVAGWFSLSGLMIAAGGVVAMTGVLIWTGGSTIFPIVIAFGGGLILASSTLGAWIGMEIGRAIRDDS